MANTNTSYLRQLAASSGDGTGGWLVTGGVVTGVYVATTETFKKGLWTSGPELPYVLYNHCQVEVGGTVVIAGGRLGNYASGGTLVLKGGAWEEVASMKQGRNFHACAELSGKVYSIGGDTASDSNILSSVEIYDPTIDVWTPSPNLPVGIKTAQAVTYKNMILLLAGVTDGGSANLQIFTLTAGDTTWQTEEFVGVDEESRSVFPAQIVTSSLIDCP